MIIGLEVTDKARCFSPECLPTGILSIDWSLTPLRSQAGHGLFLVSAPRGCHLVVRRGTCSREQAPKLAPLRAGIKVWLSP